MRKRRGAASKSKIRMALPLFLQREGRKRYWTCKPNSVTALPPLAIIPLGRSLLDGSSDLPEGSDAPSRHVDHFLGGNDFPSYLVLLRVGFAVPRALLPGRCALTAPFHPYLSLVAKAVCFLLRFPSGRLQGDPPHAKAALVGGPAKTAIPDVIRHTALRSSDFPPSPREESDRPVQYQFNHIDVLKLTGDANSRRPQILGIAQRRRATTKPL